MSTDGPEPEINLDGGLAYESVAALLRLVSPDGSDVVELDPADDGSNCRVFVAVEDGHELSHEDRIQIYGILLDHVGECDGPA